MYKCINATHCFSFIAMDLVPHLDTLVVVSACFVATATRLLHHALGCDFILICLLLLKNVPACSYKLIRRRAWHQVKYEHCDTNMV